MVTVLIAARALNRAGALTLPFLTVLLGRRWHAGPDQIGLIMSGYGLATIPSRLAGGRLADTLGARTTIVLGLLSTAAAQAAIAWSPSLAVAAASIAGLGLVFELYEPPTQALLAGHTAAADHAAVFGRLAAALAAAGIVAGLLGAALARADPRPLFLIDAATCVACALLVFIAVPAHTRPATQPVVAGIGGSPAGAGAGLSAGGGAGSCGGVGVGCSSAGEGVGSCGGARSGRREWTRAAHVRQFRATCGPSGYRAALRDRRLLALLGTGTVFATVYLQTTVVLPLTLAYRHRPAGDLGFLLTVSAVTIVAGQVVTRRRRWPHFPACAAGYLLLGAGLAATGLVTTRPGFVGATALWSLGDLVLLGRTTTIAAGLAPPGERGRYLAAYGMSWEIAAVAAPLTGTRLLAAGPAAPWLAAAAACLVLAALQPALRRVIAGRSVTGLRAEKPPNPANASQPRNATP